MPRECKVCKLKKTHPKAFKKLTSEIKNPGNLSMSKFIVELNKDFKLDITKMNVSRHKTHMGGNVIEIKGEDITKTEQPPEQNSTDQISFNTSLPQLDPKHEKFLLNYRANGYRDKEKAYKDAGYKGAKGAYELIERPEIQAALNEIRAIDFIKLKITGNQIIAGIGKVANYPDHIDKMYDDEGRPITNIKKWPEELRCALNAVEMTEDVVRAEDDEIILKRRFKFKFESHLKAKQELRKHYMEIDLYQKSRREDQQYKDIIERLIDDKINPVTAGLEIDKLGKEIPEALKIMMRNSKGSEIEVEDHGVKSRIKKRMEKLKNAD